MPGDPPHNTGFQGGLRPPQFDDPAMPTTYTGECEVHLPWQEDCTPPPDDRVSLQHLPAPRDDFAPANTTWLGCVVYTPHYKPVTLAVRPTGAEPASEVMDLLRIHAPGVPVGLFDCLTPLHPQPHAGYGAFVRYHSCVRGCGAEGQVAVVLDLTRVGGKYFATVLPRRLEYRALLHYFEPLTSYDEEPCYFHVGCRSNPWPVQAVVELRDGDVITVLRDRAARFAKHRYEALFQPPIEWGQLQHFPRLHFDVGTCALYRHHRYCFPLQDQQGDDAIQHVMEQLNLNPQVTAMCSFPIQDLDVHGDLCTFVVTVADIMVPTSLEAQRHPPRDIFVLLDFRPIGYKPRFLYTNVPIVHIPSIAARFDITLPAAYQFGVAGGHHVGQDVHIDGHSRLLFFAKEADPEASVPSPDSDNTGHGDDGPHRQPVPARAPEEALPVAPQMPLPRRHEPARDHTSAQPLAVISEDPTGYFDPTLPAGHSWNVSTNTVPQFDTFSVAGAMSSWEGTYDPAAAALGRTGDLGSGEPGPGASAGTDVPMTNAEHSPLDPRSPERELFETIALIYAFLDVVLAGRARGAPPARLVVAHPQPVRANAYLVAAPVWPVATAAVLLDCTRSSGALFAAALPTFLSRESLLIAAGLQQHDDVEVYIHGLQQCLAPLQWVALLDGMTLAFVPRTQPAPPSIALRDMLATREGWTGLEVFGPRSYPGSHFLILTDGQPLLFAVEAGRRRTFKIDLARQLGSNPEALTLKSTCPGLIDVFVEGYVVTGVIVATEQLSRLPCPPARARDDRLIIVLDCRRVRQGFQWFLHSQDVLRVQAIADRFRDTCPPGYLVSVTGATAERVYGIQVFYVAHGQVLCIDFVAEPVAAPIAGDTLPGPSRPSDGPADTGGDASDPDPPTDRASTSSSPGRSRSPHTTGGTRSRQTAMAAIARPSPMQFVAEAGAQAIVLFAAQWAGFLQTLVHATAVVAPQVMQAWSVLFAHLCHMQGRALTARPGLAEAAVVGIDARVPRPSAVPVDFAEVPPCPRDDDITQVQAVFVILAPDYSPDKVTMTVTVPQTVADLTDLLQVCRQPALAANFPELVPVRPQVDSRWALFVARPLWSHRRPTVCFDLTAIDNRVFALAMPPCVDRFALLAGAGLSLQTAVDVYVPMRRDPLVDGDEVELRAGHRVRFAPAGAARSPVVYLAAMLQSPASWGTEDTLPPRQGLDHIYFVGDVANYALPSVHRQPWMYRAALAEQFGLQESRLTLTPARPPPGNVCVVGRQCRTVTAVGDDRQAGRDCRIGLLDCRPLLLGWQRLCAEHGWLDVRSVWRELTQYVPAGWTIVLSGCPVDRPWLHIAPGQVIVASVQREVPDERPTEPGFTSYGDGGTPSAGPPEPEPDPSEGEAQASAPGQHCGDTEATPAGRQHAAEICTGLAGVWVVASGVLSAIAGIVVRCARPTGRPPRLLLFLLVVAVAPVVGGRSGEVHALTAGESSLRLADVAGVCHVGRRGDCNDRLRANRGRPLPTPCRNLPTAQESGRERQSLDALETLLDECVAQSSEWAFLAVTLLETVIDHLAVPHVRAVARGPEVSLERLVPISAFQQQSLALQEILPPPVQDITRATDWLDNDLSALLQFSEISLTLRTAFLNIRLWHDSPVWDAITRVDVFTDGSALGRHEPLRSAPAGWAFTVWVTVGAVNYFYGAASGVAVQPGSPVYLGETSDTPLQSELLAVCWALAWILEYGPGFACPVHLRYDCQAAGRGTFCEAVPAQLDGPGVGPTLSQFASLLRQCVQCRVDLESSYVPGHAGYMGNELSDGFAKYARLHTPQSSNDLLPEWPSRLAQHPLVAWAWLAAGYAPDLPRLYAFEAAAACWQAHRTARSAPVLGVSQAPTPSQPVRYDLTFATYNVLTLLDQPQRRDRTVCARAGLKMAGKRHLLIEQCHAAGVRVIGLQETRLQDTATLPDSTYLLLHSSATEAGHFGCALWLSKVLPYARADGRPLFFDATHCAVAALSPRHLLVTVSAPHFKCAFLVAHAPSDPQGGHGAEEETVAGSYFHDFLLSHALCLPCTFSGVHTGDTWTWSSARGDRHRLDYVAIPQGWVEFVTSSRVWYALEAMQKRDDHIPVLLRCTFQRAVRDRPVDVFRRKSCRPNDLDPKLDRAVFLGQLGRSCVPTWDLDVDSHFAHFVQTWTAAGQTVIEAAAAAPRQSFLTGDTMKLVDARKALRAYLKQEEAELARRYQLIGFAGFVLHMQGRTFSERARARAGLWLRDVEVSIARAWASLGLACRLLRHAVRTDRNQYLEKLAHEVTLADLSRPKQLYQRARKAFPKAASARRSRFTALPAVETNDGLLATTAEDRAECWREHFADQECGVPTSPRAFQERLFQADRRHHVGGSPVFDVSLLPSLSSIEAAVLGLRRAKAAGPDGITAELLKVSPGLAARHLVALHLKSVMAVQEPVEYKGGALMTLAKRAAAAFGRNKYRSILLSSVTGKVFHKGIRDHLTPAFLQHSPDLHGGVKSGVGVDTISLSVKCFQTHVSRSGGLPALVFYDVRAAYYQVVRETLTGDELDDRVLLQLFARLGVPASAYGELRDHLSRLAFLADCGCSAHAVALAKEVFTGTWFRLDQHAPLVATAAGVRPGDPLADIMFAMSFSAYVRSVQEALGQRSLHTDLPASACQPPWHADLPPTVLGPASWADDFVAMHSARTVPEVIERVRAATSVYLEHATANGIQLAFAADKTAVVLPPAASHADGVGIHRDGAEAWLEVPNALTGGAACLPIVPAYKHLGSIITSAGTVLPEVHYRHSQATWTLKPLRGVLFGNPGIPMHVRRHLLASLVTSKFVFGSATLELHVAGHWRLWARLYTSSYKALRPRSQACQPFHSYEILANAQASTPPLALAKARGGFLLRLLERGPATLRQLLLLQWEADPHRSWFAQILQDIQHVALYCTGARTLLETACPVRSLIEAMQEDRAWWKRQLRAATKQCGQDLEAWCAARRAADVVATQSPVGDVRLGLAPFQCYMLHTPHVSPAFAISTTFLGFSVITEARRHA
ncbi:CFDP2 [Symbiodinium sp. CCMP2456]|nr:CFDP2 [Symbiodinium sp. CCMP2456]